MSTERKRVKRVRYTTGDEDIFGLLDFYSTYGIYDATRGELSDKEEFRITLTVEKIRRDS